MKGLDYVRLQSDIAIDNDLEHVSDAAFRTFVEMIGICALDLSDGVIDYSRVSKLCNSPLVHDAITELEASGHIVCSNDTITIRAYEKYQKSKAEVMYLRDKNRKAVGDYRKRLLSDEYGEQSKSKSKSIKEPPLSPLPEQWETDFEAWWSEYPKKVGKPAGKKAYKAALKKEQKVRILGGLRRHLPYWANQDIQFVPNPSTWLNQERWNDNPGGESGIDPDVALALAENKNPRRVR